MKNEFARTEAGIMNSFFMYPEIEKAYEEFGFIQKRYDKIVKNTIDLPSTNGYPRRRYSDPNSENVGGPSYNPELSDSEIMWGLEDMHQELLNLLNNPPPMDFPDPPDRPNDLCQCDKTIREQYELELSQWSEKFWDYEDKLLQAYKRIHRFITDNNSANPSAITSLGADLQRALQLAIQRRDDKLSALMSTYWNDITREEVIVMAAIANEREKQKLGVADINASVMQRVKGLLFSDHFNLYIDQQVLAKNYNLLFDYSFYLSHEYHKQLCEPTRDTWHTGFFRWQGWLEQYNRFNFEMDMDFELHIKGLDNKPAIKAGGKLKIDPVYVSIGRMGCKWQLFKSMINHETAMEDEVPLTVKVNYSAIKYIKEAEIWKEYGYAGPNEMQMMFPSVRFSFCNGAGQDTLLLDVFRFSDAKLHGHMDACPRHCDFAKIYCLDILEYANKMIIGIMKGRDNAPEFTELAAEMMDLSSEVHTDPTGSSLLDQIQIEYSANLQRHKKQEKLWTISKIGGAVILFDATNGSSILIDKPADVRNKEIEIKFELVRGTINTKVEHKPVTLVPPRLQQY
jgi:ribosomal protein S18